MPTELQLKSPLEGPSVPPDNRHASFPDELSRSSQSWPLARCPPHPLGPQWSLALFRPVDPLHFILDSSVLAPAATGCPGISFPYLELHFSAPERCLGASITQALDTCSQALGILPPQQPCPAFGWNEEPRVWSNVNFLSGSQRTACGSWFSPLI